MKGELISKQHVSKQAAFLFISLRQHLLALSSELSCKIVEQGSLDQRVIAELIDLDVREALDTIASLPQRVVDERWFEQLDDVEQPAKRKIATS